MITCSRHYDILAKARTRMTTAITFSRQNDAGSHVSNPQYRENLVLLVVLVLESKGLLQLNISTTATLGTEESDYCREV